MAEVIEPACERVGLAPVRADGLTSAGEINAQVFRRLKDDDIVIADLSDANANVMYELGLRHTRDRLTVQIGEYGRLPFDINTIRTIQFSRSPAGLIAARDELIAVLEAGIAGDYDLVTATRVWNQPESTADDAGAEQGSNTDKPARANGDGAADGDDRGMIDILAEAEVQTPVLIRAIEDVGACSADMGRLAETSTEEIARSDEAGKGARGRLLIVTKHAQGLSEIAERLDKAVATYESALQDVSAANLLIIGRMTEDETERAEGQQYGMMVRTMARVTRESMESTAGLVESIATNARMSRVLKEPSRQLADAFRRMTRATLVVDEWDRRLQSIGVPIPEAGWKPDLPMQRNAESTMASPDLIPEAQ